MKDKSRLQAAKDEQNNIFYETIETLVKDINSSSPLDQKKLDEKVIEIATGNINIIYNMGSNDREGSLLDQLRKKNLNQKKNLMK